MSHHKAVWFGIAVFLAVTFAPPANAQSVLLEGARLVAGDGGVAVEDTAILVERGTIAHIGRRGEVAAPPRATRVDLTGKTVMPALIATHVHPGFQSGLTYRAENFKRETILEDLNRALYFGVSTVMSQGIERDEVMYQIRTEQAEGRLVVPPAPYVGGRTVDHLVVQLGMFEADADELNQVLGLDPDRQAALVNRPVVDVADADRQHPQTELVGIERAERLAEHLAYGIARIRPRNRGGAEPALA